jgi:TRAP-type transport system periplasmic protein
MRPTLAPIVCSMLLSWTLSAASLAAPVVIKFTTLAPEGTTWMEVMKSAGAEVKAKTKGNVEFKYYAGGIAGDEPDVLRKMRAGQYHGGGFTGVGLGEILPEVRILELPLFYRSMEELDHVRDALTAEFDRHFKEKGQIFLGWAEPGLVYIFAQKPLTSVSDMGGVKLWAWEADPLAEAVIRTFKVTPVNIALPDVLMALQTGMLNAVYCPPLAAMALQWHTKVKFVMTEPLTNATGAALVSKKQWDLISPADQAIVKSVFGPALKRLTLTTRQQNVEALAKFKQLGISLVPATKQGLEELQAAASAIRPQLVGKLYSAELLKKVEGLIAEFRRKHHSGP